MSLPPHDGRTCPSGCPGPHEPLVNGGPMSQWLTQLPLGAINGVPVATAMMPAAVFVYTQPPAVVVGPSATLAPSVSAVFPAGTFR